MEKKYLALSFDDGPNCTTTAEVLDVLESFGVTASFFFNRTEYYSAKHSHDKEAA